MSLRDLAAEAIADDPWYPANQDEIRTKNPAEIALIALAPELAVLCDKASRWIDMVLSQGAILEGDAALGDEIVKAVLELEARP